VDALSTPIQFLSQAEMRAKQLKGLGIDENDISEVSVSVVQRQTSTPTLSAGVVGPQSPAVATTKPPASQPTGAATQTQTTASDKEKKGAAAFCLVSTKTTCVSSSAWPSLHG